MYLIQNLDVTEEVQVFQSARKWLKKLKIKPQKQKLRIWDFNKDQLKSYTVCTFLSA